MRLITTGKSAARLGTATLVGATLLGNSVAAGGAVSASTAAQTLQNIQTLQNTRTQAHTVDILADLGTDLGFIFVRPGDTVRVHVKQDFTSSSRLWYAVNDDNEGVTFQQKSGDSSYNGYGVTFTYLVQPQARGTVSLLFVLVNPKLEQHPNSALMWVKLRVLP